MRGLKCASLNNSHVNSHRNHTNRIFYKDIFITIDRSLSPTGRSHWIIWRLWGSLCVGAGRKGNEITGCNWKWWCKSIKSPKRVYWPHPSVPPPLKLQFRFRLVCLLRSYSHSECPVTLLGWFRIFYPLPHFFNHRHHHWLSAQPAIFFHLS